MANKLKRRFTTRETVLLVLLLVVLLVGLYFGLVYYPISTRTDEVNRQLDEVALQIDVAKQLKSDYDRMKAEVDRIHESGGDSTLMPQYNNNEQQEVLNACFAIIFAGMDSNVSFGTPSAANDGVRTRSVSFSFTVDESNSGAQTAYEKAKSVLHQLMNTGFRCSMSSLTFGNFSDLEHATTVHVNCSITFYELDA